MLVGRPPAHLDSSRTALVTARGESAATTYLLYDGRRARVDLRNHAVVRALKLDGIAPRPVSRALLDAVPEAPEYHRACRPSGRRPVAAARVPGGYGGATDSRRFRGVLRRARRRRPARRRGGGRPHQVHVFDTGATSSPWRRISSAVRRLSTNFPLPHSPIAPASPKGLCSVRNPEPCSWVIHCRSEDDHAVQLAQADDTGANVDSFAMQPGRSAFVRATSVSGEGAATGTLYFVNDSGVVFGIRDADTAQRLGPGEPGACAVDTARSVAARSRTQRPERVSREGQRRSDVVAASPTLSPQPARSTPRHRGRPLASQSGWAGSAGSAPGIDSGRRCASAAVATPGLRSPLRAASTVPLPTAGSQPAEGPCAVSSMRCMTCRAVSSGARDRSRATIPLTTGAA